LYYRLNGVHLKVPSLKERKDDLPLLIDSFIKKFAAENEKEITGIDSKAKAALLKYDWPGNIRQLQNCIESSVVMSNGKQIKLEDLPLSVSEYTGQEAISIPMGISLEDAEKIIIMQNLSANKGNKSKTADILGIGRKTLHRKLNEYGLELSDDDDDE
jgi:DNA-binding NtrC family response regulator